MKSSLFAAVAGTVLLAACAAQAPHYPAYPAVFPYPTTMSQMPVPQAQPSASANQAAAVLQKDEYGCQTSAGLTWSVLHQQCVQLFNVANIRMVDPDNNALAAYAIFSKDRKQAEIFSASLPKGIILSATKGGYVSKDGKIRLVEHGRNNWKLSR